MSHATPFVVGHRAAELLLADFFVSDRLDHVRAGNEHVRSIAGHKNKISDGRRINRAARTRPHDRADLGNHSACQRVAEKNVGIARKRFHALLNSRSSGIIQADYGRADSHRQVHNFRDLRGVGLRERATKDGEVLREHVHEATIDAAIAGDEAVARRALRFHAEIMGLMANKLVELFERAFVEQQVDAFACAELALLVLAFAALCSAALFGFSVELAQLLDAVVTLAVRVFPRHCQSVRLTHCGEFFRQGTSGYNAPVSGRRVSAPNDGDRSSFSRAGEPCGFGVVVIVITLIKMSSVPSSVRGPIVSLPMKYPTATATTGLT